MVEQIPRGKIRMPKRPQERDKTILIQRQCLSQSLSFLKEKFKHTRFFRGPTLNKPGNNYNCEAVPKLRLAAPIFCRQECLKCAGWLVWRKELLHVKYIAPKNVQHEHHILTSYLVTQQKLVGPFYYSEQQDMIITTFQAVFALSSTLYIGHSLRSL